MVNQTIFEKLNWAGDKKDLRNTEQIYFKKKQV